KKKKYQKKKKKKKKNNVKDDQQVQFNAFACRVSFWNFFVCGVGIDYRKHLLHPSNIAQVQGINDLIRIDDFLKSRAKAHRKFWHAFVQTQAFEKFIEDILFENSLPDARKYQIQWFHKFCF
ncbi:hypothetical protein RFI_33517, partial [Reticulomyxa filosa]